MSKDNPEMTADDVLEIVELLGRNRIDVCVDGGWGVDALLGEQTRLHSDLDIAIQHIDVTEIRLLLEARGFKDVPRDDTRDCNFVLGDDLGRFVDIHTYTFDSSGKLVYGIEYPFDSLNGTGSVNGVPVKCITPEWMVKFHTGYKLDENDYHDVKLLCRRFGLQIPLEYKEIQMNIEVTEASLDDKPLLQRLLEFYEYDFSEFENTDLDSHGSFGYPWLDLYWNDKGRYPFLVRVGGRLAGFVLVNQKTYLPDREWAISEFFIMRKYRGQGVGKVVAFSIFDRFHGKWEVHELESNVPSQRFWRKVISEYTHGKYTETNLDDDRSKGPIQCFEN